MTEQEKCDVVVVGAGTAGSIVTRRLIDAGRRVLLLEAGGQDTNPMIHDLSGMGTLWHGPEDWDHYSTPQEQAAGRQLHLPRGKVLGGSHALNAGAGFNRGWPLGPRGTVGRHTARVLTVSARGLTTRAGTREAAHRLT